MAKRKTCYRLFVGETCVAVGDIDYIAETLGISASTAQHYPYPDHCPKELRLEPLPVLYEWNGAVLTADEVAKSANVAKGTVITAAHRGAGVRGHIVRKFQYEQGRIRVDRIDYLRRQERKRMKDAKRQD